MNDSMKMIYHSVDTVRIWTSQTSSSSCDSHFVHRCSSCLCFTGVCPCVSELMWMLSCWISASLVRIRLLYLLRYIGDSST